MMAVASNNRASRGDKNTRKKTQAWQAPARSAAQRRAAPSAPVHERRAFATP
jgi:hypothetical protein